MNSFFCASIDCKATWATPTPRGFVTLFNAKTSISQLDALGTGSLVITGFLLRHTLIRKISAPLLHQCRFDGLPCRFSGQLPSPRGPRPWYRGRTVRGPTASIKKRTLDQTPSARFRRRTSKRSFSPPERSRPFEVR